MLHTASFGTGVIAAGWSWCYCLVCEDFGFWIKSVGAWTRDHRSWIGNSPCIRHTPRPVLRFLPVRSLTLTRWYRPRRRSIVTFWQNARSDVFAKPPAYDLRRHRGAMRNLRYRRGAGRDGLLLEFCVRCIRRAHYLMPYFVFDQLGVTPEGWW